MRADSITLKLLGKEADIAGARAGNAVGDQPWKPWYVTFLLLPWPALTFNSCLNIRYHAVD